MSIAAQLLILHYCLVNFHVTLKLTQVIDIEEMSWAPNYGLKGMIDASVRVTVESGSAGTIDKIMPLEFKSGKANGQVH